MRIYWFTYVGAGEDIGGKELEKPTLFLCIHRRIGFFFEEKIRQITKSTVTLGNFPHKSFSLKKNRPETKFGFWNAGKLTQPKTTNDPYVIAFEFLPITGKEESKADRRLQGIVETLIVLLPILNQYVEEKSRVHDGVLPISESQQLTIGISKGNLLSCDLGAHMHQFLCGKSERFFQEIPRNLQRLWEYLTGQDSNIERFALTLVPQQEGNLTLSVPGLGTCCLCLHPNSGTEVSNRDSGYSLLSKNIDSEYQLLVLLVGMVEIYHLFQGEQESWDFQLAMAETFEKQGS